MVGGGKSRAQCDCGAALVPLDNCLVIRHHSVELLGLELSNKLDPRLTIDGDGAGGHRVQLDIQLIAQLSRARQ